MALAVNSVNAASAALRQWWPGASWVNIGGHRRLLLPVQRYLQLCFRPDHRADPHVQQCSGADHRDRGREKISDRAQQITALIAGVRAARLAGMVWFDRRQDQGIYHHDWRLEDDMAALAAFRAYLL